MVLWPANIFPLVLSKCRWYMCNHTMSLVTIPTLASSQKINKVRYRGRRAGSVAHCRCFQSHFLLSCISGEVRLRYCTRKLCLAKPFCLRACEAISAFLLQFLGRETSLLWWQGTARCLHGAGDQKALLSNAMQGSASSVPHWTLPTQRGTNDSWVAHLQLNDVFWAALPRM